MAIAISGLEQGEVSAKMAVNIIEEKKNAADIPIVKPRTMLFV